ncbi:DUF4407 domain-containing protein [Marinoscillum furvescens]|uniref:Uncharacterized protein DUF4407 n=1 Tax=Marinoscillum furvescens DSM 4134 TaxID=1122208 RepID=A0A3D9L7K4_MARFU|nr:DUF4407 domain-containing protein [Marinoscillum furvescens]REE01290.1 uncharacterized protein DUF4407 [Marinoscillum furvescens DSM 4134]
MNRLKTFFWLCAGANREILSRCPSESSKYVGIGATIFFTGVFAALAGGYALYTVFDSYLAAAFFGLLWGLMIFNLDRFIVSSMRKNDEPLQEFYQVLPRLVLALVISIVIAKPLELKVFEKEVNAEIALMVQEDQALRELVVKDRFVASRNRLQADIALLKSELTEKADRRDELRRIAREEADGTGGTGQRNAGPIYRIKKADADRAEEELNGLVAANTPLIREKEEALKALNQREQAELQSLEANQLTGLASRIEALDRLTTKSSAVHLAHWFIMLLFLVVETAPIFVKLIAQRGPYDYVLKTEEYGFEAFHHEDLAQMVSEIKKRTTKLTEEEVEYLHARLQLGLNRS